MSIPMIIAETLEMIGPIIIYSVFTIITGTHDLYLLKYFDT